MIAIPPHLTTSRILVVDDIAANLRLMSAILKGAGLTDITLQESPQKALSMHQETPFDLVLLDINMPGMNGFAFMQAMGLPTLENPPVIALTALQDTETRHQALAMGARDFISKPFDHLELLLRVRNNLQASFSFRQLHQHRLQLEQEVKERTRLLEHSRNAIINALSAAAEYRDDDTGAHVMRIGESAALLAQRIGQSAEYVEHIRLAAPMHDVGKIGVPDHILLKPGKLTEEELESMRAHVQIGHAILSVEQHAPVIEMAAEIALYHHEKWDGTGYPQQIKSEDIPLSARIVALCDVYDALTSPRPYKKAWTREEACQLIRNESGRHFDPALTACFLDIEPHIAALKHSEPRHSFIQTKPD